jgi:hypothetical protein
VTLDVIAGAMSADVNSVVDAGAIYVWEGGATLAGAVSPTAALSVPGAVTGDGLGSGSLGIQPADVSGDGVLDIVAGAYAADVSGVVDAGAIYVWNGGALTGAVSPTATLTVPGAIASDQLGLSEDGIRLVDVTGDGVLNVVAGAYAADVSGGVDAGAIYVWEGGATLAGPASPVATLTVPGAVAFDLLGWAEGARGILLADATGDGVVDVLGSAMDADVSGTLETGAAYLWTGGSTIASAPTTTFSVPGAAAVDRLGGR